MYGGFTRITVFGGTWPAQIWRLFMEKAAVDLPVREFPTPDVNYVAVAVDVTQSPYCLPNPFTLPQNIQTLEFIAGTEPTQTCTEPDARCRRSPCRPWSGSPRHAAMTILADAGFYVKVVLAISTQPAGHRHLPESRPPASRPSRPARSRSRSSKDRAFAEP